MKRQRGKFPSDFTGKMACRFSHNDMADTLVFQSIMAAMLGFQTNRWEYNSFLCKPFLWFQLIQAKEVYWICVNHLPCV